MTGKLIRWPGEDPGDAPAVASAVLRTDREAACRACDVAAERCPLKQLAERRPCLWRAHLGRPGAVCLGADPPRWGAEPGTAAPPEVRHV